MEHEVFVPVPAERLREVLADPARVARAVPGLQQDAGAEPVAGRLKVRVGSHSVTYRGSVRLSRRDDGAYAVEGEGTEARGTGSVKLALTLRVRDTDDGSTLTFDGTATADGRVTELPAEAVGGAVTRLLSRFAENLGAVAEEVPSAPETAESLATEDFEPAATGDFEATPDADDAPVPAPTEEAAPVPPPSLDPTADEDDTAGGVSGDFAEAAEPPAEAAHARRTMIGRSAEEVDHAPPRGRYAPVPAPQAVTRSTPLRWAAPAAAVLLASAVVVNRVLRKRR
ncbi:SRPBCC domain-containing protein [Streptomyces sp. S.PNR 29]|uniref:SRPBCC domain-containing protein n=1 Tax=Streptomyces sp. S.PNR 29 TaxID=2973805 RepID=UPI0025B15B91|nr:SRPBCC domain-containing protein [Streptomyces sp. S.PNR 29]MDN0198265.1 SRPBCC domain-containing protein [Streptomyces sp. S.PNR 29]